MARRNIFSELIKKPNKANGRYLSFSTLVARPSPSSVSYTLLFYYDASINCLMHALE